MTTLLALLLVAAAGALLPGGGVEQRRATRVTTGRQPAAAPASSRRLPWWTLAGPLWSTVAARRESGALQAEVDALLEGLTGELRTGVDPRDALQSAARGLPRMIGVAAVAASPSADPAVALRELAMAPGGAAAEHLAVVWEVARSTGCALAPSVERLHAARRAEQRLRHEVAAALAGPRATARLLSGLPVVGVVLGSGLGADPLGFLLGTGPGRAVLVAGLALVAIGVRWTAAITCSATRDLVDPGRPA